MDLPQALKRLRKLSGAPQTKIATAASISTTQYQNYEYGKSEPTASVLTALSNFFNVPSDYLLGRGIFKNWEGIMENKERIFLDLYSMNEAFKTLQLERWDEVHLMQFFPTIFNEISISADGKCIHYSHALPFSDIKSLRFKNPNRA